jgi:hypothetical protein
MNRSKWQMKEMVLHKLCGRNLFQLGDVVVWDLNKVQQHPENM